MIKAPCKNCPERHEACHDQCQKYIAFRDEKLKQNLWMSMKNQYSVKPSGAKYNKNMGAYVFPQRGINRRNRTKTEIPEEDKKVR